MFKHLFATMNEVLDEILLQLPNAKGALKAELEEELGALKAISDDCIEHWLLFEEKLGKTLSVGNASVTSSLASASDSNQLQNVPQPAEEAQPHSAEGKDAVEFIRGQGFYMLLMYEQATREFEALLTREPDFLLARAYLAMGYLRQGDNEEAARHFTLLLALTENKQMKAISYNAMGCIQFQNRNLEQALEYFKKAYHADPDCLELFSASNE
ncbi:tetratricopeptide repeat protein [Paenibacillus chitinolyticus]|uniref:tetratricopeptide repeat protein n=1 Tax=Paenibacillus chitinolyticus TaxID=79263 RepID=UPI003650DCA5